MFEEVDCVIFDGTIVERAHGDDGELRAGFLFKFGAKGLEPLASTGRDYAGKIGDIAGRDDYLDVVREYGSDHEQKQKSADRKPQPAERMYEGQMSSRSERRY